MISKTTNVVNNEFQVTFDFTPDNLYHCRTNSKGTYGSNHVANGTTARYGIGEGIEIIETGTKVGNNAGRSHGTSSHVTVSTKDNNVPIQGKAKYRLRTMGYHGNDFSGTYPFFGFGNISGNPNKYSKGYFTDSSPSSPGNEHYYCVVPPDGSYRWCEWSDGAYKHANDTKNGAISNGRYEQRNGNYEAAKDNNGGIAESGNKQMGRKSMMFYFEKEYSDSVTSSGISTHPNTPQLNVNGAKGDSGQVSVTYTDNAGIGGKILLKAYCGNKTVEIINFDSPGTFYSGQTKTYDIDFNYYFGEECRGNDVYYEAGSMNTLGYGGHSSTGGVGVQRYNGRPTKPSNLNIQGVGGIIYNKIAINGHGGGDPEGDGIVYDLGAKITSKDGQVLKDDYIARGFNGLTMEYDISNYPEECNIEIGVCSSDSSIVSDWFGPVACKKGAVPKGHPVLIYPAVSGTNLYNKRPRFSFDGYDGVSEFIMVINGREFSSIHNSHLFHILGSRVIFKTNFDLEENISCYAYMKNQYGNSQTSMTYNFTIKNPYKNIAEGNIITSQDVKDIQLLLADFGRAYNRNFQYEEANRETYIKASIYNACYDLINDITGTINNGIPDSKFQYGLNCSHVQPGQVNDDELWNKLINELYNV